MELVLIGGVSGSGKSVALAALEDAGYDTIGNLPVALVVPTVDHLSRAAKPPASRSRSTRRTRPGSPGSARRSTC